MDAAQHAPAGWGAASALQPCSVNTMSRTPWGVVGDDLQSAHGARGSGKRGGTAQSAASPWAVDVAPRARVTAVHARASNFKPPSGGGGSRIQQVRAPSQSSGFRPAAQPQQPIVHVPGLQQQRQQQEHRQQPRDPYQKGPAHGGVAVDPEDEGRPARYLSGGPKQQRRLTPPLNVHIPGLPSPPRQEEPMPEPRGQQTQRRAAPPQSRDTAPAQEHSHELRGQVADARTRKMEARRARIEAVRAPQHRITITLNSWYRGVLRVSVSSFQGFICKKYSYFSVFLAEIQGFEGPDRDSYDAGAPRRRARQPRGGSTALGGAGGVSGAARA